MWLQGVKTSEIISSVADAAAMFRVTLPKEQDEKRVFVLPQDGSGKALVKPIPVSVRADCKIQVMCWQ